MLQRLRLINFALIDELSIEFSDRLNILTGETGAGKSILIHAIRFVFGEKVDGVRLEAGAGKMCSVEAVFSLDPKLRQDEIFSGYFQEEDGEFILRRESSSEKNRAWVNGRSANLSTLRQLGSRLVDIHGQYDHQLLLDSSSHIGIVDRFAAIENLKEGYQKIFQDYEKCLQERGRLNRLEENRERELDLLKYQIDEIGHVRLKEAEEEELKVEQSRLSNVEKLSESVNRLLACLDEDDAAASSWMARAHREMTLLARFDPSLEKTKGDYESVQLNLEELIRSLRNYRDELSFEPERLEEIERRLGLIDLLKRKYGNSISKILSFFEESKKKYDDLCNAALYRGEVDKKIQALLPQLKEKAAALKEERKKAGAVLKKTIETELKDLGISQARFECRIEEKDFSLEGSDHLEFFICLNPGRPLAPLAKIVSGGEVSRVMLALKKVLAKVDDIPTLIFDEIDANIGGRLGTVTGKKLKEVSCDRQVLLITHLPQIASFADRHFKVTKKIERGKTVVEYRTIEGRERVRELAQMMSGQRETEIAKLHAQEMLSRAE